MNRWRKSALVAGAVALLHASAVASGLVCPMGADGYRGHAHGAGAAGHARHGAGGGLAVHAEHAPAAHATVAAMYDHADHDHQAGVAEQQHREGPEERHDPACATSTACITVLATAAWHPASHALPDHRHAETRPRAAHAAPDVAPDTPPPRA